MGNAGNQTAYDVEVKFDLAAGRSLYYQELPAGTLEKFPDGTIIEKNAQFTDAIWKIPELPAGGIYEVTFRIYGNNPSGLTSRYVATVTSAYSHEGETRLHNNRDTVWQNWASTNSVNTPKMDYLTRVRVDDRHPSAGDTVNFSVVVENHKQSSTTNEKTEHILDGCVNVQLTAGLTAGTPTFSKQISRRDDGAYTSPLATDSGSSFASSTTRECGDTSNATGFYLLPRYTSANASIMTLPVTISSNANVSQQCITAEIFAAQAPYESIDDKPDNRTHYCLGNPTDIHVFDEGTVNVWTPSPCKYGVGGGSCDTADEIEVNVFTELAQSGGSGGHSHGDNDVDMLDNGTALIHIKDVPGRVFDGDDGSLNPGTSVSWMTATDEDPDFTGTRAGVKVYRFRKFIYNFRDNWENYNITYKATGLDGGDPPGKMSVRSPSSGRAFWELTPANSYTSRRATNYSVTSTPSSWRNMEFETLGTYVVDFTAHMKHKTLTNSDVTDGRFEGTGRAIFHVGPIAELGVQDGGTSLQVSPDQVAFTVTAINSQDEDAESGKIVVELPAETTGLKTIPASTGSFDSSANPPTWTWDIHNLDLVSPDRRSSQGRPPDAITLIVNGVNEGANATAKIVYDPYEVCVASDGTTATATTDATCNAITGASWHSGNVFDVDSSNNTATLIARRGPVPATLRAPEYTAGLTIRWDAVELLYGIPVKHYEVQRRSSPWKTVAKVEEPSYFDSDVQIGASYEYRIRAVNNSDHAGPWSSSVEGVAMVPKPSPYSTARILRIEPSITDVSLRGGDLVRLSVEVYGRQDLRDDSLGDATDVTFDWTLEEFGAQPGGTVGRLVAPESSNSDQTRTSTLDGRRVLYISGDSPGQFRITVSLEPGSECMPQQTYETEEEAQERCTAVFEVTALRSSQIDTATLNPLNPEGVIPDVLADSDGFQYEVFTPVNGGAFVHESASLTLGAGAVPDYEMIGLRISEAGPARNEGVTFGKYTLGGDWYDITAVDASGLRVENSYQLNDALDVCVPLPPELSSNISDLVMVAVKPDNSPTVLSTRVRITTSGNKVCGNLSTVPASVAVGTTGAPKPLPTAFPETSGSTGFPNAGGFAPPYQGRSALDGNDRFDHIRS